MLDFSRLNQFFLFLINLVCQFQFNSELDNFYVFSFAASVLLMTFMKLISLTMKYGLQFSSSSYIIYLHLWKCQSWSQNFHKIHLCITVKQLISLDNSNVRVTLAKNSKERVIKNTACFSKFQESY